MDNEGWNFKEVIVDLIQEDDGEFTPVIMNMWFDLNIEYMGDEYKTYLIIVNFRYQLRSPVGDPPILEGTLQNTIVDINDLSL